MAMQSKNSSKYLVLFLSFIISLALGLALVGIGINALEGGTGFAASNLTSRPLLAYALFALAALCVANPFISFYAGSKAFSRVILYTSIGAVLVIPIIIM